MLALLKSGLETSITENIYRHKPVLESIFRAIDKDHSGQISKEEFRNVCGLINQHDPTAKLSHDVIEDLANTMDIDKDGLINFNEVSILNKRIALLESYNQRRHCKYFAFEKLSYNVIVSKFEHLLEFSIYLFDLLSLKYIKIKNSDIHFLKK